ncbi:MAG: hypothetical protein ACD_64C00344G0001, partial [uncultured bacterium]
MKYILISILLVSGSLHSAGFSLACSAATAQRSATASTAQATQATTFRNTVHSAIFTASKGASVVRNPVLSALTYGLKKGLGYVHPLTQKYINWQKAGEYQKLVKAAEDLQAKIDKCWFLPMRFEHAQLETIQEILDQPITKELGIIKNGTFKEALKAIKRIRRLSPFKYASQVSEKANDSYYRICLEDYLEKMGCNQLWIAEDLFASRADYIEMTGGNTIRTVGTPRPFGFSDGRNPVNQRVLENVDLNDNSASEVQQMNPGKVVSSKLEDTTDMVLTTPTDADLLAKYITVDPRKDFDAFTHQFAELLQVAGQHGALTAERLVFFTGGVAEGAALRASDIAADPGKFVGEMVQGNIALVQSVSSLMYDIITAPEGDLVTQAQMERYEQRIAERMEAVISNYNTISAKMKTMSSREYGNLIGRLGIDYAIAKGGPKVIGAATEALVRLEGSALSGTAFFEGLRQRLGMFIENPQLVTPEGITFNVPTVAKTAAEIAADAKAAAK